MHLCKASIFTRSFSLIALLWAIFLLKPICGQSVEASVEKCVKEILAIRPELKERFDVGLLKVACRKRVQWTKLAANGVSKSTSNPLLTPSQTAWADQLFQCFDRKCMCQMFDHCRHELKRVNRPIGNLTNTTTFQIRTIQKRSLGDFRVLQQSIDPGHQQRKRAISEVDRLLSQKIGRATRKEIRQLTDEERRHFFTALQTLKAQKIDTMSKYDIMIVQHTAEYSPGAHFSAALLPFHREFSKNLEMALRTVDPSTALPYWDPTLDQGLPDARDSILWTDDFMGNGIGDVTTGPFANWTTVTDAQFTDLSPNKRIVRNVGVSPYGSLYRDSDLESIMTRTRFRDMVYCVDPFFELVHGANHLWIGGHMNELRISPNDPIFFLFHGFVDYIWEEWRQTKQDYALRPRDYVSNAESCNQFAQGRAKMRPYTITNIDGLSNQYTDVLYSYEPRPVCSESKPDCGTPYVFCHTGRSKCLSKIRSGGNCTGLEKFEPCWIGKCVRGRCVSTAGKDSVDVDAATTIQAPIGTATPPPTAPPKRTPAASNSSQNTVWVPITVLSVNGRAGASFPNAKIVTTDESSTEQLTGTVADPSQKPYYMGAAFAQVKSPFSPDQNGPVRVKVEVFDDNGRKCAGMCQERGATYNACEVSFSLTATSEQTDGVAFAQSVALAKELNWQGDRHSPDRYLFMCPTGKSRASPGTAAPKGPPIEGQATTAAPKPAPKPVSPGFSISTNGEESGGSGDNDITIKIVHSTDNGATKPPQGGGSIGAPPGDARPGDASSSGPAPQGFDDCTNDHRCCPIWGAVGECNRNPWMKIACRKVCRVCKSSQATSNACADLHPKCQSWANDGQCDKNDLWMEENCKKSCDVCDRSVNELKSFCGAAPNKGGGCVNQDSLCVEWAKQWECVNNPWWMKENCPEACNYCNIKVL